MRAIVVRHYKTAGNLARKIIGWTESPPAEGWQADLMHVMQCLQSFDIEFQLVYTSDLKRARDTGLFYARSLGIEEVLQAPPLREINYGQVSKKSKDWVEKHIPLHKKDPQFVYPGGESFAQMQQRSVQCMEMLAARYPDQTLLIVAHAGVIRGLISHFLRLDYADNLRRKITHRYIGDYLFEGSECVRYDELGAPSGYIKDGLVKPPVQLTVASAPR